MDYIRNLKIGNVQLENNILLAPMAGITDLPFRKICKQFGVGLVCTEMVSAKALYYGDEKTKKLLNIKGEKRPISVQLFGSDVQSMIRATEYVSQFADIIDINMGCPAPKIVKNGDGSKLLLDLDLIKKIVTNVVNVSKIPVTVKIRKGWDENSIVAINTARIIEDSGASAITVHGRLRNQFYAGKVDLDIIRQVKQNVNIPVIGNGDIVDSETAKKMFEYTGVDAIMCARGVLGNPWIFKQIIDELKYNRKFVKPTLKERLNIILKHIDLEIEEKGEETAIKEIRKHIAWYIKGLKDASLIREKVNKITKKIYLIDCLTEYFSKI